MGGGFKIDWACTKLGFHHHLFFHEMSQQFTLHTRFTINRLAKASQSQPTANLFSYYKP